MVADNLLDLDWTAAILLYWLLASVFFLCSKPSQQPSLRLVISFCFGGLLFQIRCRGVSCRSDREKTKY
jgi:hypothetical protein